MIVVELCGFCVSSTRSVWFSLGPADSVPGASLSMSTCLLIRDMHICAIAFAAPLHRDDITANTHIQMDACREQGH